MTAKYVQFMSYFILKYWEIICLHFLSYHVSFTTRTETIVSDSENEATINQYLFYFLGLLCCYGTEELTARILYDERPVYWHQVMNMKMHSLEDKNTIKFVLKFHRLLHVDKVIRYIISDLYLHIIVFLIWHRESALLTFWDISAAIYDIIMLIIWL
jgi:hypothetical protein